MGAHDEVHGALEAWATPKRRTFGFDGTPCANRRDILNARASLLRFLEELDADLSVGEMRTALEDYDTEDQP